ncbi:MAG: hypothetical protein JXQ65_07320 [Candidatus Marinimicrobia bacterium]|nr:hypothetical protein [Candidatus Neomarinimicrobiota bacterium]
MPLPKSDTLLKKLEKTRNSKLISYITSNRQPGNLFPTRVAQDIIPLLYEHLKSICNGTKKISKISLFLNTLGGDLNAPWPIVNLLREFCEQFEVIIPRDAKSAGTLMCLGANRIVMSPISQLSPVDPEGVFQRDGKKQRIEVEDVLGFVDFAKERIGLNEQESLSEALKLLCNEVNPTIVGSVNRTLSLIRRLSENLLKLHLTDISSQAQIEQIVGHLTQKLFSHNHSIGRDEAKNLLGFKDIIEYADDGVWEVSDLLIAEYHDFLNENKPFNPQDHLTENGEGTFEASRAILETTNHGHVYEATYNVIKDQNQGIKINVVSQGWKKYERRKENDTNSSKQRRKNH